MRPKATPQPSNPPARSATARMNFLRGFAGAEGAAEGVIMRMASGSTFFVTEVSFIRLSTD